MKNLYTILLAIFISANIFAQSPEKMNYQAVARDNAGNILNNQLISFRISILQGSSTGASVYSETHSVTSNDFGLANLNIGNGSIVSGDFTSIAWPVDLHFLKVEMDPAGGLAFQLMGTSQLLSVPYALFAKTAESLTNGSHSLSDADGNTKIQVEKNPNEDIIRFDIGGTEQWIMTETRIEPQNSGGSVFIGEDAGLADDTTNNRNIAIGRAALKANVDRDKLVAIGDSTMYNNGIGATAGWHSTGNTAVGTKALFANTIGHGNTAIGQFTLMDNTTGAHNTVNGLEAMYKNTSGQRNTAMGFQTMYSNSTAQNNTAVGYQTMYSNTTSSNNVALGYQTMYSNTTGYRNVALGVFSMLNNISGNSNTAVGYSSLRYNTSGENNTTSGAYSLSNNTTGYSNTAIGISALYHNTIISNLVAIGDSALYHNGIGGGNLGIYNTAIGSKSLYSNTTGYANTAIGFESLYLNTLGTSNTATGYKSLYQNTGGEDNTATGFKSLYSNTTGYANTATGMFSLYKNTGSDNTATGERSMYSNTSGYRNSALGSYSMYSNTSGDYNTAVGYWAMEFNTSGYENTAIGASSLANTTTAGRNVGVGYQAGYHNSTGFYNTAVGYKAGPASSNIKNSTALGRGASTTAWNQIRIGNNIVTSIGGYASWTNLSDKRFKKEIQQDIVGLDFIMALQPVSYQLDMEKLEQDTGNNRHTSDSSYKETAAEREFNLQSKIDKGSIRQSGFIAQDVELAAELVGYDFSGVDKPKNEDDFYGLRYAEFVVPLVKGMQELVGRNNQLAELVVGQQEIIEQQNINYEKLLKRVEELEHKKTNKMDN